MGTASQPDGYDANRELIIDPGLDYSTFLGGTSHEFGTGIVVDAAGNAYIVGVTQSPNFPDHRGRIRPNRLRQQQPGCLRDEN